jgi:hypothetical protein
MRPWAGAARLTPFMGDPFELGFVTDKRLGALTLP